MKQRRTRFIVSSGWNQGRLEHKRLYNVEKDDFVWTWKLEIDNSMTVGYWNSAFGFPSIHGTHYKDSVCAMSEASPCLLLTCTVPWAVLDAGRRRVPDHIKGRPQFRSRPHGSFSSTQSSL
jgi:hypothetical protein